MDSFGFGSLNLSVEELSVPDNVFQSGYPPVRFDILTSLTGVPRDEAVAGRVPGKYGEVEVCYPGKNEYRINKQAPGREKDLADLEAIGER